MSARLYLLGLLMFSGRLASSGQEVAAPLATAQSGLAPPAGTSDGAISPSGLAVFPPTQDFMLSLQPAVSRAGEYHMTPVRAIHARVQSDAPIFDDAHGRFISLLGSTDFDTGYLAAMDGVNTASVEGALMYVQAEGINYNSRSEEARCHRKNDMKYVVFYEVVIAQTNETLALYEDVADQNEYGPMVPIDQGRCSPSDVENGTEVFPKECEYFNGDNGEPNIGPFVGGESKALDVRAPYPDNYWFSFPNTCPLKTWPEKTPACRAKTRRGLCAFGIMPDGVLCTFAYRILGFVPIDDVVGITSMVSATNGRPFADFEAFCRDGGVEFQATPDGQWENGLAFWAHPQDKQANAARALRLIETYQNLTSGAWHSTLINASVVARMLPLPAVADLTRTNPPCYRNVKRCNTVYGCRRETYAQLCRVCAKPGQEGCVAKPAEFEFPILKKAVGTSGTTGIAKKSMRDDARRRRGVDEGSRSRSTPGSGAMALVVMNVRVWGVGLLVALIASI